MPVDSWCNSCFYKLTLILPNLWTWMCPVCPFQRKHICTWEALLQSHTKRVSWWSFLNIPSANESNLASPLNTLFHASNTVKRVSNPHVFLIGFYSWYLANIKGIPLSSWCIIWNPRVSSPSLMFSKWDWESIGPFASPKCF